MAQPFVSCFGILLLWLGPAGRGGVGPRTAGWWRGVGGSGSAVVALVAWDFARSAAASPRRLHLLAQTKNHLWFKSLEIFSPSSNQIVFGASQAS